MTEADDVYQLSHHSTRGYAVIANVKKNRPGSELDAEMMRQLFSGMHYMVKMFEDPTKEGCTSNAIFLKLN